MRERRLRLPTTLVFSLLGVAGCSSTAGPDGGPGPTVNCGTLCRSRTAVPAQNCVAARTDDGGLACTSTVDAGLTLCSVSSLITAPEGNCCCEPVV